MMEYKNLEIKTAEGVYEPAEDSFLAAGMISDCLSEMDKEVEVLDIGTGTGILGLTAATSSNVKRVVFADINEEAIDLAKMNFEKNRDAIKSMAEFIRSDLLSDIPRDRYFDLIIFNAPYLRSESGEGKEHSAWSGGREGVELSIRFLEKAVTHLTNEGRIILVSSSLSNQDKLKLKINKFGLTILKEKKVHVFFEDIIAFLLEKDSHSDSPAFE